MRCPDCSGELVMHTAGEKAGRGHCNACGVCWPADALVLTVIDSDSAPQPARRTRKKVSSGADD